jgi:hypothetical protein
MDERSAMSEMRKTLTRMGVAGAASAAVLVATAYFPATAGATMATTSTVLTKPTGTSGHAASTGSLSEIKARAGSAVSHRVNILNSAVANIDAEKDLGAAGRAQLHAFLSADIPRLRQQRHVVAADTVVAQAQHDYVDIFYGFRVFRLVLPAASLAARADRVTKIDLPALRAAVSKAQAAAGGQNQARVEPLVQDLQRQIAAATSGTQGLASTVLAYTPAEWNANNALLTPETTAVSTAEGAIRQGRADVQQIQQELHGATNGGGAKPHHHHR